ncbi:MAG TPA: molecular chaperone TorD family protein [Dehalococcoidia bacterium]|nr:molecular chaperone TorD family protein [Dehalococcoidia bacterium]
MVAPTIDKEEAKVEAVGRSVVYALLSQTIAYPNEERLTLLREQLGDLFEAVADAADESLGVAMRRVLTSMDAPIQELQHAYNMQFSHIVSPDCPTNETAYSVKDVFQQAQAMADVAGFFRAHGLQVGGPERERPDHIGAELEFMRHVAQQEAMALEQGLAAEAAECERSQDLFLREHLGCWGAQFGGRVALAAKHPFYRHVGELLNAWIGVELETRGITPERSLDEPMPMPPPMDEDGCGVDCPVADGGDELIPIESIQGEG